MTAIPSPALRLAAAARCLVLDPMLGPVPREVALLADGAQVLAVAEGAMCFRPVTRHAQAGPPRQVALLPRDSLGEGRPAIDLLLPARQEIAPFEAGSAAIPAAQLCLPASTQDDASWLWLEVEGAQRVIVDGVGLVPFVQNDEPAPPAPVAEFAEIVALRAFAGPQEVKLVAAEPRPGGSALRFAVPPRTAAVRLVSDTFHASGDYRRLGVALLGLAVEEAEIALDNPGLVRGFYPIEQHEDVRWRWTDGEALLLLPPRPAAQTLDVQIADWHQSMGG
jgi:hypothetical protein